MFIYKYLDTVSGSSQLPQQLQCTNWNEVILQVFSKDSLSMVISEVN